MIFQNRESLVSSLHRRALLRVVSCVGRLASASNEFCFRFFQNALSAFESIEAMDAGEMTPLQLKDRTLRFRNGRILG